MKALSVRQPWATLISRGLKTVEIRSWSTRHRGPLLIHASRTVDEAAMRRFGLRDLPLGALVGQVELVDVRPFTADSWNLLAEEHLDPGRFQAGLYAWLLERPRSLDAPVPWRGVPGLFEASPAPGSSPDRETPARQTLLFEE